MKKQKSSCSNENQGRLVIGMAIVIVILAGIVIYSFALKPVFNGYVASKQVEAQDIVLQALLSQLQQNGYMQIPFGEDVITLVPYQIPEQEATLE